MTTHGRQQIIANINIRPQRRFKNPRGYLLAAENDVDYCSFKIDAPKKSGIYRILVNDQVVYIGRAKCLKNRLSQQYGNVSPRHPYSGGQIQKCRTNAKINAAVSLGDIVSVEWTECLDFVEREKLLLKDASNRPPWNLRS